MIAFVRTRDDIGLWTVHPDGSDLRQLTAPARGPCWSPHGDWLYYESVEKGSISFRKIRPGGSESVVVLADPIGTVMTVSADDTALYHCATLRLSLRGFFGRNDQEIGRLRADSGESETLARISGDRIPGLPPILYIVASPDDRWLASALVDAATTNLWLLPTAGGEMKKVTDFGDRSVDIARSISWSADGRHLYAAIADIETDIVLFDGLIQ